MKRHHSMLIAAVLAAAACGPSIQYQRDASLPIPAGATWAWSAADADSPAPAEASAPAPDSIIRMFADAIEADLVARGFPRVSAGEAAFVVHFHLARRTMIDTLPLRDDAQPQPGAWGVYGRPEAMGNRVVAWEEGMLVVDVMPRDRRAVAWRGIIADEIPAAAERNPAAGIREAVARLMRGFP
jgi:hypothetical protein